MIVGLSGYARSGKDETAKVFIDHGYKKVAFADKLRDVLYALNPIVIADFGFEFSSDWNGPGFITLQDAIDIFGWDGYKSSVFGTEIRRLLQRLGTEAGRQTMWDSIWVDAAFAGYNESDNIVVTDCRFPNEAQAIKDRGGMVLRVSRPGVDALNNHASETSLDTWDFDGFINNNGSLEDLERTVTRKFL